MCDHIERYNEMLDEIGTTEIGNISFCPSRVLSELDPIAYSCGFDAFLSSIDVVDCDECGA